MRKFKTIFWLLLVLILFACSKKEVAEPEKMSDYFVMQPGYWWVFNLYQIDSLGNKGELIIDSMTVVEEKEVGGRRCFAVNDFINIGGVISTVTNHLYADDSLGSFYALVGPDEKMVWVDVANIHKDEFKSGPYEMDLTKLFLGDPELGFKGKWNVETRKLGMRDTIINGLKVKMMVLDITYLYDGVLRKADKEIPMNLKTHAVFFVGKGIGNICQKIDPTKNSAGEFISVGYDIHLVKWNVGKAN